MFLESRNGPTAQDIRVAKLHENLSPGRVPRVVLGHEKNPGTIAVVPMYSDTRLAEGAPTIDALAAQEYSDTIDLVIANNGLSEHAIREVLGMAEAHGIDTTVVDALPRSKDEQSAGYARNIALDTIHAAAETNPAFRKDGILFLDDDAVLLPNGLHRLETTTHANDGCVATMARNISSPTIDAEAQAAYRDAALADMPVRKMPEVVSSEGHVDVGSLIAFGSDAVIKTCGVYVDHQSLAQLHEPFVRMPSGSAEDVLLTVGLSQFGTIYTDPNAILLDQARETPLQLRKQRLHWGRDHVHLFDDMDRLGKVQDNGITVLEPVGEKWVESVYEHPKHTNGLIINPAQLNELGKRLAGMLNTQGPEAFGIDVSIDTLFSEISTMYRTLQELTATKPKTTRTRNDLPAPIVADTNQTRYSDDALLGLLMGNVLGNIDIRQESGNIVYGLRQAAAW